MPKKPKLNEGDQSVFREAMRGTKPISHTKIALGSSPPLKSKKQISETEEPEIDIFSDYESLESVGRDSILQYSRPGIQHKILRNLRNGKYNVEAVLDLHGMTVIEARSALSRFLLECQKSNTRHVLIIHGKGHADKPVLKNRLNHWLRQTEQVLAFCSATNRDGSTGSLYVLLKG